ncbi:MAG: amphi-Trp domain-containing protein [Clostridia bacterium]|nr:amphi-Trp domain-containing protein [Clostridia bacterium]
MKHQASFTGNRAEFADFLKRAIPDLFGGRLEVEGKRVAIPADKVLDYKIKADEDEFGGSFSLKVAWNLVEEAEEDEEESEEIVRAIPVSKPKKDDFWTTK